MKEYREERLRRGLPVYEPFYIDRDYRLYLDGKPRYDGIQSLLSAKAIEVPYGHPEDPPERDARGGVFAEANVLGTRYLVVDTPNWLPGWKVFIFP